jgi:hypothetical protein
MPTAESNLEQILLIRMRAALERLEPGKTLLAQAVLRQHAADGLAEDLAATPFRHHAVHVDLLETAGSRRVRAVQLLEALLARCVQVRAVDGYDIVAAVGRGVEDGLVLAHQGERYRGGYATQGAGVRADVDEMPGARVREARLGRLIGV